MKKNKVNKKVILLWIVIIGMLIFCCIPVQNNNFNSKTKLEIISSYGDNEAYHPKVLNFENKWNGYKYWMSYTPYPKGNGEFENPHVIASNNLIDWETPNGLINPLDDISQDGVIEKYDSDAHLVYNPDFDRLECYWRYVNDIENEVIIYRRYTLDGVNFSDKEIFIQSNDRKSLDYVSPAIIYEDGKYKMWYVDKKKVNYRETTDGINWSDIKTVNLIYEKSNLFTWHIDVVKTPKGYEMIMVAYTDANKRKTMNLYYSYSNNEITNWSKSIKILEPTTKTNNWDNSGLYRSSFIYENGKYIVFYSGISINNEHGIGIVYGENIEKLKSIDIDFKKNQNKNILLELINK